jgi:hypothetical protein
VVRELPFAAKPLSPEVVANKLDLSVDRVKTILDDLEKHMTFLFRNSQGEVIWAYPVTVDKTPHHVTFNTGEQLYAAWAADAFATPFVQGQLRNEHISVNVKTECAHCSRPMEIEIDSDLKFSVKDENCKPIVFVPDVDLFKIQDDNIINAFWNESVFFWSEEHAREDRKKGQRIRGAYFTATQMAKGTRIIQSAIFGFEQWRWKHREPPRKTLYIGFLCDWPGSTADLCPD